MGAGPSRFRFHLLGPLAVARDHVPLSARDIGSRKERTLLKLLLDRWERDLATLVSRLRAVFRADAIVGGRAG